MPKVDIKGPHVDLKGSKVDVKGTKVEVSALTWTCLFPLSRWISRCPVPSWRASWP
ncbi:AHNAK nucleoprotein 2 [Apodemus speciosus]|uniref:AHNAK nucleoprotein 2 n=1 Tax=Apodemus speciosus TaxID=105296 RepID=A0ABQ0FFL8_APOSI